jgi:integrase
MVWHVQQHLRTSWLTGRGLCKLKLGQPIEPVSGGNLMASLSTPQLSHSSNCSFVALTTVGLHPIPRAGVWRELNRASEAAGLGHMGTHTFRHSYRMWLDSIGTPVGVQQKLMRHSDIRTTMNIYGDAATEDMREAHNKIVGLALPTV